jgi:hypothetical protein
MSTDNGIEWTFYGIAENTAAAAIAFEMAYNLIVEWARPYRGIGSRNSYCLGVSQELYFIAEAEKRAEQREAEKAEREAFLAQVRQEELQRQAEIDRLAPLPDNSPDTEAPEHFDAETPTIFPSSQIKTEGVDENHIVGCETLSNGYHEEDDNDTLEPDFKLEDDAQIDLSGDIDEMIKRLVQPEPELEHNFDPSDLSRRSSTHTLLNEPDMKQERNDVSVPDSNWKSTMQLIKFRATASKIAEDYLKASGIKLTSFRTGHTSIRDYSAYAQGKRDSKKIDVRRNRIAA